MPPRVSSVSTDGSSVRKHRKQRVGEHGVRNAALDGVRTTNRDGESTLRGLFGDRRHEMRLADPAFADDEKRAAVAGIGVGECAPRTPTFRPRGRRGERPSDCVGDLLARAVDVGAEGRGPFSQISAQMTAVC